MLLAVGLCLVTVPVYGLELPSAPVSAAVQTDAENSLSDRTTIALERLLVKTEGFVEKTAPEVWRIYVQQIEVEASTNWVNSTLFFVLTSFGVFFSVRRFRFYKEKKENAINRQSEWDFQNCAEVSLIVAWALAVVSIIALIISMSDIVHAIEMTRNPEYYALQRIINHVK